MSRAESGEEQAKGKKGGKKIQKSVKALEGYAIGATDGAIGKLDDFYFDDQSWTIRYLVADTGSYFPALDLQGKVYTQIVKSSPVSGRFESYLLFLLSITAAQKSIHIANPYFLPDERIQEALINAVKRGVSVVVLTPAKGDHATVYAASRGGFAPFLVGGVEIYENASTVDSAQPDFVGGVALSGWKSPVRSGRRPSACCVG